MHTAMINRIAVDRAGRWAVTASDDKTARIWNLASGQLVRVLRVPLGGGMRASFMRWPSAPMAPWWPWGASPNPMG